LTVLEDGQLPITMRSKWHDVGTAAMAVATEPVPCMCFLVGGNFDSISQIHPALIGRFYGYEKVVRINDDMPNTVENRRKYVQFIAQEVKRFHLIPFSREACEEIIDEGRRRSGKKDASTTRFRPLISIVTSSPRASVGFRRSQGAWMVEALPRFQRCAPASSASFGRATMPFGSPRRFLPDCRPIPLDSPFKFIAIHPRPHRQGLPAKPR